MSDYEFGERLQRIRRSLDRINSMMAELRGRSGYREAGRGKEGKIIALAAFRLRKEQRRLT